MRHFIFFILTASMGSIQAQTTDTLNHVAVRTCVQRLFNAMLNTDTVVLRSCFYTDATLKTVTSKGELASEPIDSFIAQVAKMKARGIKVDERVTSWHIQTDQHLAAVWVTYELYVNEKYVHQGVDALQLIHTPDGWKIFQLCDTRRH